MTTYNAFKSVNLPWLNNIPSNWDVVRNKLLLKESKTTVGINSADYTLLSLTKGGVIVRDLSQMKGKFPSDFGSYKTVSDGQIVFCLFDVDETPRTVGLSKHEGMITGAYDVFSIDGVNPRFIEYYYISLDDVKAMRPLYTGLRKVIGMNTFMQTHFPLPPRDEQDQIVRYLDWKVSLINKLINAKRRQIALLREENTSSISSAISHGVTNGGKHKATDIPWIDELPESWSVSTMKNHFSIEKRTAGKEGYDVLSITQTGLKIKDVSSNEGQIAASYANYQFVYPGDFAMNHMDLLTGYVDIASCFGVTSPDYRVFCLTDKVRCHPDYFLRVFQVCYKRKIFYGYGRGAASHGRWRMPRVNFVNFQIPLPPINEQMEIAHYCDSVERTTKQIIDTLESKLTLFSEYRTRLISDVVTGKFDVRDVVVPEYEAVEENTDSDNTETDDGSLDENGED